MPDIIAGGGGRRRARHAGKEYDKHKDTRNAHTEHQVREIIHCSNKKLFEGVYTSR